MLPEASRLARRELCKWGLVLLPLLLTAAAGASSLSTQRTVVSVPALRCNGHAAQQDDLKEAGPCNRWISVCLLRRSQLPFSDLEMSGKKVSRSISRVANANSSMMLQFSRGQKRPAHTAQHAEAPIRIPGQNLTS